MACKSPTFHYFKVHNLNFILSKKSTKSLPKILELTLESHRQHQSRYTPRPDLWPGTVPGMCVRSISPPLILFNHLFNWKSEKSFKWCFSNLCEGRIPPYEYLILRVAMCRNQLFRMLWPGQVTHLMLVKKGMKNIWQTWEPVSTDWRGCCVSVFQNLIHRSAVPPPDVSKPC